MTLVVVRRFGSSVQIASDLRLTHEWGIDRGYTKAAMLKAVTIGPDRCVAYAGDSYRAGLRGLRHAARYANENSKVIADEIAGLEIDAAHFLVASSNPPAIHRVARDVVEYDMPAAWLGDADAFEAFQERFHNPTRLTGFAGAPPSDTELRAIAFSHAFNQVVLEQPTPTVGEGWVLIASERDGLFHYLSNGVVTGTMQFEPTAEWSDIPVGGVAQGAFGYVVMRTTEPGIGAIGLYFDLIAFGVLYHPLLCDDPLSYRRVSRDEFQRRVFTDYGLAIA